MIQKYLFILGTVIRLCYSQTRVFINIPNCVGLYRTCLPPANEVCVGYVFKSVCLSTGGVPGQVPPRQVPAGQVHPWQVPPWQVHPPWAGASQAGTPPAGTAPGRYPLGRYTSEGRYLPGRYTPWAGTSQARIPPQAGTDPLGEYTPPDTVHAGYGQQAGGTHPTGMHSCFDLKTKNGVTGIHECDLWIPLESILQVINMLTGLHFFPVENLIFFVHWMCGITLESVSLQTWCEMVPV